MCRWKHNTIFHSVVFLIFNENSIKMATFSWNLHDILTGEAPVVFIAIILICLVSDHFVFTHIITGLFSPADFSKVHFMGKLHRL